MTSESQTVPRYVLSSLPLPTPVPAQHVVLHSLPQDLALPVQERAIHITGRAARGRGGGSFRPVPVIALDMRL